MGVFICLGGKKDSSVADLTSRLAFELQNIRPFGKENELRV
jgi:hypothetical protein